MSLTAVHSVWLRINLPEGERAALHESFKNEPCQFLTERDADLDPATLARIEAVFTHEPLSDALVQRMPNLRWVHGTRGGVYAYLTPSMFDRPIDVSGARGIHGEPFSEFALAAMLALAKQLPLGRDAQHEHRWEVLPQSQLAGKTVCILGLGVIGTAIARKCRALGMRVVATKRQVQGAVADVDELRPPEEVKDLLRGADYIVITLPSTPLIACLLGEDELRACKPSAYLVNLTAGEVIAEPLLVQALSEGWIAGAALDALPRQPLPPDSLLWDMPNALVTARIAGQGGQRWDAQIPIFATNLRRFLRGEPLLNVIDKTLGY